MTGLLFLSFICLAQIKPKSNQAPGSTKTKQPISLNKTEKDSILPDGSKVVYDTSRIFWTQVSPYAGSPFSKVVPDSKGNIYCYSSYYKDSSEVYKLEGGKWKNISLHFFKSSVELFVDGWDNLFAISDKCVYKLNGEHWKLVWKFNLPDIQVEFSQTWIALDGNLYRIPGTGLYSKLYKWNNDKWELIGNTYWGVWIDKTGKIYTRARADNITGKEKINTWNGSEWITILEETDIQKIWIENRNYLYAHIYTKDANNEWYSVIKKWDGVIWSNIPLPGPGQITIYNSNQFGNIVLKFGNKNNNKKYYNNIAGEFIEFEDTIRITTFVINDRLFDFTKEVLWEYNHTPKWKITARTISAATLEFASSGLTIEKKYSGVGVFKGDKEIIPPYLEDIYLDWNRDGFSSTTGVLVLKDKKLKGQFLVAVKDVAENFNANEFIAVGYMNKCEECNGTGKKSVTTSTLIPGSTETTITNKTEYKETTEWKWDMNLKRNVPVIKLTPVTRSETSTNKTPVSKEYTTTYSNCNICAGKGIHWYAKRYCSVDVLGMEPGKIISLIRK